MTGNERSRISLSMASEPRRMGFGGAAVCPQGRWPVRLSIEHLLLGLGVAAAGVVELATSLPGRAPLALARDALAWVGSSGLMLDGLRGSGGAPVEWRLASHEAESADVAPAAMPDEAGGWASAPEAPATHEVPVTAEVPRIAAVAPVCEPGPTMPEPGVTVDPERALLVMHRLAAAGDICVEVRGTRVDVWRERFGDGSRAGQRLHVRTLGPYLPRGEAVRRG